MAHVGKEFAPCAIGYFSRLADFRFAFDARGDVASDANDTNYPDHVIAYRYFSGHEVANSRD